MLTESQSASADGSIDRVHQFLDAGHDLKGWRDGGCGGRGRRGSGRQPRLFSDSRRVPKKRRELNTAALAGFSQNHSLVRAEISDSASLNLPAARTATAVTLRSLAGGNFGRRLFDRLLGMQSLVFDQAPAHIQKANRLVFKRRAARIVAKVDVGALIDGVERPQAPRNAAAIQTRRH